MEQGTFDIRFFQLQASANERGWDYGFRDKEDIWQNIGSNPLDTLFTRLAELYLECSESQRQELHDYCGIQHQYLENAWYFIRRIGMLIHSQEDQKWLEIGIASALLDGGRADFRDLIVSLVLLRSMAEKREINTETILDNFIPSADDHMKGILENVRDHSRSDISYTVSTFGPAKSKQMKVNRQEKKPFWSAWLDFFNRH